MYRRCRCFSVCLRWLQAVPGSCRLIDYINRFCCAGLSARHFIVLRPSSLRLCWQRNAANQPTSSRPKSLPLLLLLAPFVFRVFCLVSCVQKWKRKQNKIKSSLMIINLVPAQSEVVSPQRNGVHHHQPHERAVAPDVRSAQGRHRGGEDETDPRPPHRRGQSPRYASL